MELLKIIKDYLLVIRPVNLLIICVSQYFIQFALIQPNVDVITLKGILFPLFVFDTVIIAASGYLINDIIDQTTDHLNKPVKQYIGNSISEFAGYMYYLFLLIVGAFITVYIADHTDTWQHIWIFPAGIWSMYIYSRSLKSTVLLGNVFISLFTAGSIGILGFAQFVIGQSLIPDLRDIIIAYMGFIFILNLMREIIKDVEDIEGDKKAELVTLPIRWGVNNTNKLLMLLNISLILTIVFWLLYSYFKTSTFYKSFLLGGILLPAIALLYLIIRASSKQDYSRLSMWIKLLMIVGMISILFVT